MGRERKAVAEIIPFPPREKGPPPLPPKLARANEVLRVISRHKAGIIGAGMSAIAIGNLLIKGYEKIFHQ